MSHFIALEGPDGSGKSSQIVHLEKAFANAALPLLRTREVGGSPNGQVIRDLLFRDDAPDWSPLAQMLLVYTDRSEHVSKVIKPALEQGRWVLSDRYAHSTLAFQGYGFEGDIKLIRKLHEIATGDFWPDFTIVLDVDYATAQKRKGKQEAEGFRDTKFEKFAESFHQRVRNGYHTMVKESPTDTVLIDAIVPEAEVHAAIIASVNKAFGLSLVPVI